MDPKLFNLIDNSMPKFNETIVDGFHAKEFDRAEKFYEDILAMTFECIKKRGVYFKGVHSVKPDEMFNVINANTGNKYFETHKESLYPVKVLFEYKDIDGTVTEIRPAYIFLPHTNKFGDLWIRGTLYSLQMVLVDRGLSVTKEDMIFVKVLGWKFKVGVENFEFNKVFTDVVPNKTGPISLNLPASRFYNASEAKKVNPTKTPTPLLAWYVFAEYGFDRAIAEFGECECLIGDLNTLIQSCKPEDGWSIYSSTGRRHNKLITDYIYLDIGVAVRPKDGIREGEIPTVALQYIGALLFTMDTVPAYFNLNRINESNFWRYIIGKCSVKSGDRDEVIMRYMNEHFSSMNESLDEGSIKRFARDRIVVNDMFELFNYIIVNRGEIVKTADRASVLHKGLSSLEFTMDKLITGANQFKHEVKNTTELNLKKIEKMITKHFHLRGIERAKTDCNLIQEDTPSDNPLCCFVLGVISQSKIFKQRSTTGDSDFNPNDPATFLHPSIAFGCSYQRVTDPNPDSRGYINPCVELSSDKYITIKPELKDLYDATSKRLTEREVRKFKQ